jgi:glycosyltransferase involved in cell wall biosynthesis
VLRRLIAFRPNVLLLTGNQNFWWLLSPLRAFGAKIFVSYHAVVWPKLLRAPPSLRLLSRLNAALILRNAESILVTSNDIRRQLQQLLGDDANRPEILHHLPSYSPQQFAGIAEPGSPSDRPFRIMFLGRMVRNKGIYDIVSIARRLESESPGQYQFDLCGSGAELDSLKQQIRDLRLEHVVRCHGFCSQDEARPLLSASHICIVPTRSDCEAGFEMTCAEAILAGRPLVTSKVSPALEYLSEATVEAAPDDANDYVRAIVELSNDPDLYERKRRACSELQGQFFDSANSWYSVMKLALERNVLSPATALESPAARSPARTTY